MKLEEVRKEIDAIDRQLLPLFLKRMDCAKQVAEIKREQHLPVLNSDREQKILDSMAQRAGNYAGEARMLYATLMDMSRALQHNLLGSGAALRELVKEAEYAPSRAEHIACLGVSGSFSHEAVQRLYPHAEPLFFDNFAAIFAAVADGRADLGVLPVENSSAGSVSEVYDLILRYRFYIVAAETLHIHNCLAAAQECPVSDIRLAYSHPQPLAQCSNFIAQHHLQTVPCSATVLHQQRRNMACISWLGTSRTMPTTAPVSSLSTGICLSPKGPIRSAFVFLFHTVPVHYTVFWLVFRQQV